MLLTLPLLRMTWLLWPPSPQQAMVDEPKCHPRSPFAVVPLLPSRQRSLPSETLACPPPAALPAFPITLPAVTKSATDSLLLPPKILIPPTPSFDSALELAEALEYGPKGKRLQMRFLGSGNVLVTPAGGEIYQALLAVNCVPPQAPLRRGLSSHNP